jgi:hypothetical protein
LVYFSTIFGNSYRNSSFNAKWASPHNNPPPYYFLIPHNGVVNSHVFI